MTVFLNGRFVSAARAAVPVNDRGFLYGDGLFETLRVRAGRPFRWQAHWERLRRGAELLRLPLPWTADALRQRAAELIRRNRMPDGVLRLQVTRGPGPRGGPLGQAGPPTVLLTLHPAPARPGGGWPRWRVITASVRLPVGDPLTSIKSCNRLPWILAGAEAEAAGADDALLRNSAGRLADTSRANLFWIERGTVCTPPLGEGALPGMTRAVVFELCRHLGLPSREKPAPPGALARAEGVFFTLSTLGVVEGIEGDGQRWRTSPVTRRLAQAYQNLLEAESRQH